MMKVLIFICLGLMLCISCKQRDSILKLEVGQHNVFFDLVLPDTSVEISTNNFATAMKKQIPDAEKVYNVKKITKDNEDAISFSAAINGKDSHNIQCTVTQGNDPVALYFENCGNNEITLANDDIEIPLSEISPTDKK